MGFTYYNNLILLSDKSDASIEKLFLKIKEFYKKDTREIKITLDEDEITLAFVNWNLYVGFSDEDHVLEESKEMAEMSAKGKVEQSIIASCKARFEMSADLDPNMDFFNDSCYVLEMMESFKDVFVFDSNDSSFVNLK